MAEMAQNRDIFAPDTPGFGNSDAPFVQPKISNYALAISDFIDQLNLTKIDLLGYQTGALIATELAITRPEQIGKSVLVGLAAFNAGEQAELNDKPFPIPPKEDGSHLTEEWARSMQWRGSRQTFEMIWQNFYYKIKTGDKGWWGAHAAINYPGLERFSLIQQPILAIRPKDDLWEISLRAKPFLSNAKWIDLPQYGFGIFEVAPKEIAELIRGWTYSK